MYQIVAAKGNYSEEEVRERLATAMPAWEIENMENKDGKGWLVRLHKNAEFPFEDDDKKDSDEDSSDDSSEDSPKDAEEDSSDDSDDSEDSEDSDGELDSTEDLEEAKKDLVKELNDVIQQAQQTLNDLGQKAQEVADDASAKDDKIKEIADTVNDLGGGPEGGPEGLGEMPADLEPPSPFAGGPGAAGPGKGPAVAPPKRAPRKRPPAPGGMNSFTKRATEVVTHPGTDYQAKRISLVTAAVELEKSDEWKDYEIVSMTKNVDGSFSAKLKLK